MFRVGRLNATSNTSRKKGLQTWRQCVLFYDAVSWSGMSLLPGVPRRKSDPDCLSWKSQLDNIKDLPKEESSEVFKDPGLSGESL